MKQEDINRKGRKIGSRNKNTEVVRSSFQLLVQNNLEQLQEDLNEMTPKDRFNSIISLAKFVLPQLNSIDINTKSLENFKPVQITFTTNESN